MWRRIRFRSHPEDILGAHVSLHGAIDRRELINRLPEVTAFFWANKLMATTVGETGAGFLTRPLGASFGDFLSQPTAPEALAPGAQLPGYC